MLVFLGWVPVQPGPGLMRLQAHAAALTSAVLGLMLLRLLGLLRGPRPHAIVVAMAVITALVMALGWTLPPDQALLLAVGLQAMLVFLGLAAALRSAWRGDRPAGWRWPAWPSCRWPSRA